MIKSIRNEHGFSILELIVTVTIVAIIVAVSLPNIRDYNSQSELRNSSKEFVSMLQYARTEAVQRNTFINVETQSEEADNFGDQIWVCTAADANQACTQNTLIRSFQIGTENVSIRSSGDPTQADSNISFNSRGQLAEAGVIDIAFCNANGSTAKAAYMNISVTGRAFVNTFDANRGHLCNPL